MPGAMTYTVGAGNREDLTDILSRITPEDTPVFSSIKTGKPCKATYHEWQCDALATPTTLGTVEGSDNSSFANPAGDRARVGNYTQIFRRNYLVSKTQQAVSTAGVDDERASASAKKMIEAKLDIDTTISSGNDRDAGSASAARQCRGLFDWIDSSGPSDVDSDFRTPAASIDAGADAITEAEYNAILASIWGVGGRIDLAVVGSTLKRTISGFTGRSSTAGTNQDASSKKAINTISMYESDFGLQTIMLSRNLLGTTTPGLSAAGTNDGLFLDRNMLEWSWLRPLAHEPLSDEGGGPRGMVEGEGTLVVKNPKGLGKHTNSA